MKHSEALDLLRPAVARRSGAWLDLGAGTGTLTLALAELLGAGGRVVAVDVDATALAALRRATRSAPSGAATITAERGDAGDLDGIASIAGVELDGVLLANVLHYISRPQDVLRSAAARLVEGGRLVVVEYDQTESNPWVPHPIDQAGLESIARRAGLGPPRVVAHHPSRFGRRLYCAVIEGATA